MREEPMLNDFIYNKCLETGAAFPDIPVQAVETYGQCGEDIIVLSMVRVVARKKKCSFANKMYVEIGANHPFATSATFMMHSQLKINGLLVEANKALVGALKRLRPYDIVVYGAVQEKDVETALFSISNLSEISSLDQSFVTSWGNGLSREVERIEVPALRINTLLQEHGQGRDIVFLSIDIEGYDLFVLSDLDFMLYRPWVIQIEPSDRHIPNNSEEIIHFLVEKGYKLIAQTSVNLIFLEASLA